MNSDPQQALAIWPLCIRVALCGATFAAVGLLPASAQQRVRFAVCNAALVGKQPGEIYDRLADGEDEQAERVARLIQEIRPDVLIVNELSSDGEHDVAELLARNFFDHPQGKGHVELFYPFIRLIPGNTGIDSGMDLNNNGKLGEPPDAYGDGEFPGQYGMAIFSRYRFVEDRVRTFQRYLWKDFKDAKRPVDRDTGESYYDDATWNGLRLSSHNHVDLPVLIYGRRVHVLACDPTPAQFDGSNNASRCRNHDEVRFWADYLRGDLGENDYIVDDNGKKGGIDRAELVVVMADMNSGAADGASDPDAVRELLQSSWLQNVVRGDDASSDRTNVGGDPRLNIIPDARMFFRQSDVVWPTSDEPDHEPGRHPSYRIVWFDVDVP